MWQENDLDNLFFDVFAEKYLKIKVWTDHSSCLIPFVPYKYQMDIVETIDNNKFVIVNCFRQGGFTTLLVGYALWKALVKPSNYTFLNKTDRLSIEVNYLMQSMIHNEDSIATQVEYENDHLIVLKNGSRINFRTPSSMVSVSPGNLFIDQAGFIPDMDAHWQALYPNIDSAVVVSSPNGTKNWFYEAYSNAVDKKNQFVAIKTNYMDHPEYRDIKWIKKTVDLLGAKGFLSEVCGVFQ